MLQNLCLGEIDTICHHISDQYIFKTLVEVGLCNKTTRGPQLLGFTGDKYIFLGLAKLVIVQDRDKKAFGKQMGIWFLTFYLKQPHVLFLSTSFCISVLLTNMGSSLVSKKNVLFPEKEQ